MPRKIDPLDAALDDILSSGWEEASPVPTIDINEYPPLPVREAPMKDFRSGPLPETQHQSVTVVRDDEDHQSILDIGLLTELASGQKNAAQAAEAAGMTVGQVQSALATTLRGMDPKEIQKALGIQAVEQQLKSGALYGAVLHELVQDMMAGRMKPDQKMDFLKFLSEIGRIKPKEEKGGGPGQGFVLNISMGGPAAPQPVIIESN